MFSTLYFILFLDYSIHFFNDHKSKRKSCLLKGSMSKTCPNILILCNKKEFLKNVKEKDQCENFDMLSTNLKSELMFFQGWKEVCDWLMLTEEHDLNILHFTWKHSWLEIQTDFEIGDLHFNFIVNLASLRIKVSEKHNKKYLKEVKLIWNKGICRLF